MGHAACPRERKTYALSIYTGTRPGELAALTFADVNLDAGYLHVHRTLTHDGQSRPTRTRDTRRVPIEAGLRLLLEALKGDPDEPVVVMPHRSELASLLRVDLAAAKIVRDELTANDQTRRPITFYDLRHTYATHCAIRGDDSLKIALRPELQGERAMGHDDLKTTQRYINEADAFGDEAKGTCFALVPASRALSGVSSGDDDETPIFSGVPKGDSNL
ncbi:MAG: tyrosine-type recombinase/integrase [Polyangiaceae bacterium]